MSGETATLELLIQIRDELAGLNRTKAGLQGVKKEAESLGAIFRQGLGIGTGMQVATSAIALLKNSLSASVGEAFRLAEEIKDQSEALEITTEAYQVLRFELAQAGVDAGRLTMAISQQTESLAAARSGIGAMADAYKALGLNAAEVEKLRPEERLAAVARGVLNATDKTVAFQSAGQILGSRGLPQLLSALRTLATDGYGNVADAAKNAGAVMNDAEVEMLDAAKQRVDNFKQFTVPVAAGTFIAGLQNSMDWVGASVSRLWHTGVQGLPAASRFDAPKPKPVPFRAPNVPTPAGADDILAVRVAVAEQKASQISSAALLTEREKRAALLPILREQEALYAKLIATKFGELGKELPKDGPVTQAELQRYKERNELEAKLVAIRQQRMETVDTPLTALNRELLDTTGLLQASLTGGVTSAISSLSSNIWGAMKATNSFGDAWRGVGNIVGQVLTDLMIKLLIVRPLLAAFGIGDAAPAGATGAGAATVVSGGGGSFLTSGPTHFTVGDNPGGVELVSVLPISGVGQTTVNGAAMRMAGGGTAMVAGGARGGLMGGDTLHVHNTFNGGVSREEVLGLVPMIVEASKAGVHEARRRHRGGHRA